VPFELPVSSTASRTIAAIQACAFTQDTHCRALVKELLTRTATTVRSGRL
jgi:hypothetical protein